MRDSNSRCGMEDLEAAAIAAMRTRNKFWETKLERVERIELSNSPCQGLRLPLHHTRNVITYYLALPTGFKPVWFPWKGKILIARWWEHNTDFYLLNFLRLCVLTINQIRYSEAGAGFAPAIFRLWAWRVTTSPPRIRIPYPHRCYCWDHCRMFKKHSSDPGRD